MAQNKPDPSPRKPSRPSYQREPAHPPRHVLDQVSGRVLDPGTALQVKGVTPRSTVYVGPRLTISRSGDVATQIRQLEEVAEELGWDLDTSDAERELAEHRRRLGLVRVELRVKGQRATLAPDGWVLLQQARARFGLEAMKGVGLDHLVTIRPIDPNPSVKR